MEEFQVEDGSNDKAYFTMVPNIVLNHSSAVDQALYMQMKRFAGEKRGGGFCTASEKTLMAKLKIGRDSLKESISYLIEHEWISFAGENLVWTEGGPQKVKAYRVNDIWRMNVEHYKGVSENAPLNEGVAETVKGVSRTAQGVAETAPIKNYKTNRTLGGETPQIVKVSEEREERTKPTKKYPHSKEVFGWFPNSQPSWAINTTELKHAELLYFRGESAVRGILGFVKKHKDDEFFPKVVKPSDLERKWEDIAAFKV